MFHLEKYDPTKSKRYLIGNAEICLPNVSFPENCKYSELNTYSPIKKLL